MGADAVVAAAADVAKPTTTGELVFTYGTLKRGFSNHGLLQDMMATGDAYLVGPCRTRRCLPLVCGPYRVPFLLNFPGRGQRVSGELYAVSQRALARMDDLEGLTRGHYERLPIEIDDLEEEDEDAAAAVGGCVWAYYAHRSYAEALWKRNIEEGSGGPHECYSHKVAIGYVKRKDRPQHLTFLEQIRLFIAASSSLPSSSSSNSNPPVVVKFDGVALSSGGPGQFNAPAAATSPIHDHHHSCTVPA